MRPALPPLAPSRTGMEIAKSPAKFGDLSHKIALIEKARTAVTTLDLNEIIDELLTIYDDDTKAMHNLQTMNSVKTTELATAKKKLDKMRSAYHELKQNTAILGLLEKEDLPQKNSRLATSILELDEERLSHKPPAIAEKPSEFIARSESDLLKFLHLTELNFKELECLIYLLKKRSVNVDQSDDSIRMINKKYGSVAELVRYQDQLMEENERLKQTERGFMEDSLTKRRPLASSSLTGTRLIVTVLQTYLESVYEFGDKLSGKITRETANHFDESCNDKTFADATKLQFENHEGQLVTGSPEEVTAALEEAFVVVKAKLEALIEENRSCAIARPIDAAENTLGPAEALMNQCSELFAGIRKKQETIDVITGETAVLAQKVISVIRDGRKYTSEYSKALFKYRDLRAAHARLTVNEFSNRTLVETLNACASSLGLPLVTDKFDEDLDAFIRKHCVPIPEPELIEPPPAKPKEEHRRKKKGGKSVLIAKMLETISAAMKPPSPPPEPQYKQLEPPPPSVADALVNRGRCERFVALELCANAHASASGGCKSTLVPRAMMHIQALREALASAFEDMKDTTNANIAQFQEAQHRLLRRPYIVTATQTTATPHSDSFAQCDPLPTKK